MVRPAQSAPASAALASEATFGDLQMPAPGDTVAELGPVLRRDRPPSLPTPPLPGLETAGRLALSLAHDFNNLLTVILGYSEALCRTVRAGDVLAEPVHEIRKAAERASELTRQLLALGRPVPASPRPISLAVLVANQENLLRHALGKRIELVTVSTDFLGLVLAVPSQIEQVVLNLVLNARDAMPQGGRITISLDNVMCDGASIRRQPGLKPGPYVLLSVSDNGQGMDAQTRRQLFTPFFTTKGAEKGTGLGLANVQGIVREMGGAVVVESEFGQGATFKLYFPRTDPGANGRPIDEDETAGCQRHETVLVFDEEAMVRALLCDTLRQHGYRVLEAKTARDALIACEGHPATIHVLVADLALARQGGAEFTGFLSSLRPEMKTLHLAEQGDRRASPHDLRHGDSGVLYKPFSPAALLCKIRSLLDSQDQ